MASPRAKLWAAFTAACFSGAAALGWAAWRPLDALIAGREAALRLSGVSRVEVEGLAAWSRDACAPGEPCRCVALVHGMGDTALTWDKLMIGGGGAPAAPRGTRILALELPGTEGSAPAADYGVRAQAAAVRRALASRCPRWTVAGNSLGGWIATWVALDWPDGVERLVLLNPAGVTDPTGRALETGRTIASPTLEALRDFDARARHSPRSAPDRVLRRVAEMILSRPVKETFAAFREADALDAHLPRLRVPLEIVWGESDRLIPLETARRFVRLARGATLTLVPACGHLPQQECPAAAASAVFAHAR